MLKYCQAHLRTHTYTHPHPHAHTLISIHACKHTHTHIHPPTHIHTYTHKHTRMHTYTHTYTHTHTHTHLHTYTRTRTRSHTIEILPNLSVDNRFYLALWSRHLLYWLQHWSYSFDAKYFSFILTLFNGPKQLEYGFVICLKTLQIFHLSRNVFLGKD